MAEQNKFLQWVFISLLLTISVKGQTYLKKNESMVISFQTIDGKKLMLAIDTVNKYLVYRYGTDKHIELEYPNDHHASYDKFKYFHYSRGSGPQNDGEEIYQLHFTILRLTTSLTRTTTIGMLSAGYTKQVS